MFVDEKGFQGFRGDLQYAAGLAQKFALLGLGGIAMPPGHRDVRLGAQLAQAAELVVDQRFQRGNVQDPHTVRRVLRQQGQDGEEGCFSLAGGCGGGQQHIVLPAEDGLPGGVLHPAQHLPAGAVDVVLNEGGVAVKDVHRVNSA